MYDCFAVSVSYFTSVRPTDLQVVTWVCEGYNLAKSLSHRSGQIQSITSAPRKLLYLIGRAQEKTAQKITKSKNSISIAQKYKANNLDCSFKEQCLLWLFNPDREGYALPYAPVQYRYTYKKQKSLQRKAIAQVRHSPLSTRRGAIPPLSWPAHSWQPSR